MMRITPKLLGIILFYVLALSCRDSKTEKPTGATNSAREDIQEVKQEGMERAMEWKGKPVDTSSVDSASAKINSEKGSVD
ncbi:hypothetical protein HX109_15140 [Galbibacter sp. BG1]|uniref:hypothetical protein n=1 Tax=Galbibacter sp. BG1 TaxID=1170699 RepID=UPI0015BF812A|nr:hypothetical protein [Galbibacter sp. BG1]QLE02835.1 hypothetical protein HX109_15140 [Galbibacter sp. BG1]